MYAITTVFERDIHPELKEIWNAIGEVCGLDHDASRTIPHFSWHVAQQYRTQDLVCHLQDCIKDTQSFTVNITGIGLFTGIEPVLYLSIVKSRFLVDLHEKIWNIAESYCESSNKLYHPDYWIPHITIAYRDVKTDKLLCAVKKVIKKDIEFSFPVQNLAIIFEIDKLTGIQETIYLKNQ